jgi:hypothetical protein
MTKKSIVQINAERARLNQARDEKVPWRKWGPYLSERQWGTVREDYSENGDAWNYFPHDQARSRAYRWGEDGIAGISDDKQRLCFALALWNGKDPIIKERLFGLTNSEGNHGEDVKEYYYYLDNTPTHSYMRYLYKYPQAAYPYETIVTSNRGRGYDKSEFELVDTGIFDDNKYFDVFVDFAKASPEDMLIEIAVHNRGTEPSELHLLPTLWFRNEWSWSPGGTKPSIRQVATQSPDTIVEATHASLGVRYLYCEGVVPLLFTENETNTQRIFNVPNQTPYVKDGINNFIVHGQENGVNPEMIGTKVSAYYRVTVNPGESRIVRLRLCDTPPVLETKTKGAIKSPLGDEFNAVLEARRHEADAFYASLTNPKISTDAANVMR